MNTQEALAVANSDELSRLVAAAQGLGKIPPREMRWAHLPLCVLDAVFSIGAQYRGTVRTVRAYAALEELVHVVEPAQQVAAGAFVATEQPVSQLRDRIDRDGSRDWWVTGSGPRPAVECRRRRQPGSTPESLMPTASTAWPR